MQALRVRDQSKVVLIKVFLSNLFIQEWVNVVNRISFAISSSITDP